MIKYASLEGSEVLEIKSSPTRTKNASFKNLSDFNDYRTDDGYLYVRLRAQSSRVNKNHDGWPTAEMAGGPEAWEKVLGQHRSSEGGFTIESSKDAEKGFSTFIGKPNFIDHHNSTPDRTRGVVVDSKFHVLDKKTAAEGDDYWGGENVDPEHMPPSEIELLVEIDAQSFPVYAKAVVNGDIDGWSMGCDVDYSKCSHCGNEATNPDEYCSHIVSKGAEHDYLSSDGTKTARKSYENCYGINYFEISGVFDPADDTATSREVRSAVLKEAIGIPAPGMPNPMQDLFQPTHEEVMAEAARMEAKGVVPAVALELASKKLRAQNDDAWGGQPRPGEGAQAPTEVPRRDFSPMPGQIPIDQPMNDPRWSSVKTAQPEEPQEMHTKAPDDIDTLRKERVCPLCGSDMEGDQCDVCGYEEPPEQFQNPDLHKNEDTEALEDAQQGEVQQQIPNENPVAPSEPNPESMATQTRNPQPTSSVISDMRWNYKTASAPKPSGDEPSETVTDDQTAPVTSAMRTAREMIEAANQENHMTNNTKVGAEPVADAKPDNRVNVDGVGGVAPGATNADASKPEGAHSWEPKGVTVDVTGKGAVLEGTNAEASEPSAGSVSNDATSDNAGYQKGGETGPKTQTWDNSNEPGSAVTDKAFPTSAVEAAKEGVKPGGGADVQPQRRENVESEEGWDNPGTPTDSWTGTDGNGVTRQQNPVTNVPTKSQGIKSGLISLAALRLADTEVSLGLITENEKYNRLAELGKLDDTEIAAEHRALAKVKTAGMTRTAAAGGAHRLPSFKRIASEEPVEAPVDDDLLDNALFS